MRSTINKIDGRKRTVIRGALSTLLVSTFLLQPALKAQSVVPGAGLAPQTGANLKEKVLRILDPRLPLDPATLAETAASVTAMPAQLRNSSLTDDGLRAQQLQWALHAANQISATSVSLVVPQATSARFSLAVTCDVTLSPGDDLQSQVDAKPAGTTFCFEPGVYQLSRGLLPKDHGPAHLRFLALAVLAAAFGPATALVGPALVSPVWADTGPGTARGSRRFSKPLSAIEVENGGEAVGRETDSTEAKTRRGSASAVARE